ncbi:hypothetical protein [Pseudomonas sp. MRSN 12121]|uniref:hypothetical protein n=1 Tax=Pseudomonas sp. MRSN 12121 TaxID=1611770 RepID=UPI0009E37811|nr:hypothetical protein [Pseudomonas sp. MRSN 12121]
MTKVTYSITIHDLQRLEDGLICGDEAVVAVLDNGREIHHERFIGKCTSPSGYTRKYRDKAGLTAAPVFGSCRMGFSLTGPAKGSSKPPTKSSDPSR